MRERFRKRGKSSFCGKNRYFRIILRAARQLIAEMDRDRAATGGTTS